jgi:hypothetical protein
MENPPNEAPELRIVNRYMANATVEQREEAMANLRQLAQVLLRIEDRLGREWHAQRIRDSGATAVESEVPSPPSS